MKRLALLGISLVFASISLVAQSGPTTTPGQNQQPVNPFASDSRSSPSLMKKFTQQRAARQPQVVENEQSFVLMGPRTTGCPAALRALQGSGRGLLSVRNPRGNVDPLPAVPTQRIHLIVASLNAMNATHVRVMIFGHSDQKRLEQTQLTNMPKYELSRTLDVTLAPDQDSKQAADLVLPGFTAVKLIQLESITYTDGSTWTGVSQACQIVPDQLMLVADR